MDNITLEDIKEIARKDFTSYPLKRILEILDEYGRKPEEKEIIRVYYALLRGSNYDIDLLKRNVISAKKDYKKFLFWAE
jgi:uncharacterized HAD superfamily protein